MRWESRVLLLAGAVAATACGSGGTSTPTPAPTSAASAAATATPSPTAPPTTAPGTGSLDVPSLNLHATLLPHSCLDLSAAGVALPAASTVFLMDCSAPTPCPSVQPCGFYGVLAPAGGVLQPLAALASAPAGTVVHIVDPAGRVIDRTLNALVGTISRSPDGSWTGHGVPPGIPLFLEIRGGTAETERTGT